MRTKTLAAAALSVLALTGAAAETASADSILFLKGGNVWLSTPDGSRHFQVTDRGGYSSASQSDDGTIAALHGQRIHKLDRFGTVLADFTTAVSDGSGGPAPFVSSFEGPFDLDISDDGRKVAYNFFWQYWTFSGTTGFHMLRQGVGVSHSDRATSWSEPGLGYQTGWLDASWYDDGTLLLGRKASAGQVDVSTDPLGTQTSDSANWFTQPELENLREPAVNRQHDRVAVVGGPDATPRLWVYRMTGEAPALPVACHEYAQPTGTFASLTWSPDGRSLAWEEGDGVWVGGGQDRCSAPDVNRLLIPGASQPDWGPADVPASRPAAPALPAGSGGGAAGGAAPAGPGTAVPAPSRAVPASAKPAPVVKQAKGAAALSWTFACRRGCTVTGRLVAPSKLAKRLRLGGRALATGRVRRASRGGARLALTLTPAGRRASARLTGQALTLRVAIKEGRRTRSLTRRVVLR
jgi:hypothetical protein